MIENTTLYKQLKDSDSDIATLQPNEMHHVIITEYLGQKDQDADVIVFSVGCANNALQRAPNFAIELAKKGEKVSVYNFDHQIFSDTPNQRGDYIQDSPEQQQAIIDRVHPNMTLRFLTESTRFPRFMTAANIQKMQIEHKWQAELDNTYYEQYISQIIDAKRSNPNLKFVLLFTVGSMWPSEAAAIVKRLEESHLFTRGKDLELVMAYSSRAPQSAVLRGYSKQDVLEYMYIKNKATKNNFYDEDKELYFFPNLDEIKNIFTSLKPTTTVTDAREAEASRQQELLFSNQNNSMTEEGKLQPDLKQSEQVAADKKHDSQRRPD